jgi:PBP1b-binding outer membrane lipoprotein LpoB
MTRSEQERIKTQIQLIDEIVNWHRLQVDTMKESSVLSTQIKISGKISGHSASIAYLGNKKKMLLRRARL